MEKEYAVILADVGRCDGPMPVGAGVRPLQVHKSASRRHYFRTDVEQQEDLRASERWRQWQAE